jgi:hypothetical protein
LGLERILFLFNSIHQCLHACKELISSSLHLQYSTSSPDVALAYLCDACLLSSPLHACCYYLFRCCGLMR